MADPRARRRALLALLPRVFSGQPDGSSLAALIATMAAALAAIDEGLTRTQRDHWLQLASGDAPGSGQPSGASALDRLGALLGIERLKGEDSEAYRGRLAITVRVLTRGLNTPRALLELAVATLGAEPCPRLTRENDTTIAYGLPPGTITRCPACRTAKGEGTCPNTAARVLEAWLTDNPPQARHLVKRLDVSAKLGERFEVDNVSLDEDVPEVALRAIGQPLSYPCLHNRKTGEIMFYAGTLQPGDVLSVQPQVGREENLRYASHDGNRAHLWRDQYPAGNAVIKRGADERAVNGQLYYLTGAFFAGPDAPPLDTEPARFASADDSEGSRFADALSHGSVFDEAELGDDDSRNNEKTARFGTSSQRVRTPRVRPGKDVWACRVYTLEDVKAIAGPHAGDLVDKAPVGTGGGQVELTLSWWARPPASFRLAVARNAWVDDAETRGAHKLLSRWIEQTRAAGVTAAVEFPETVDMTSARRSRP